jgi:hypothetical protein
VYADSDHAKVTILALHGSILQESGFSIAYRLSHRRSIEIPATTWV